MKKFEVPTINIQKLVSENILTGSSCFEKFACTECYCSLVQCNQTKYSCTGLVCGTLSDYD